ncbi:MAG TPA: aminoglycoside phosphotransferase family protein, partial [Nocardioidaceae bacterium]|nr:aminoglycoside phosphotransferase family protein [Nocardioidaceae bacterium]
RVLPGLARPGAATLRTVRYNPARRWVGVVERGEQTALLRAYRTDDTSRHARAYAALQGRGSPTPRLLGLSRRYGTAAVEWVPGRELTAAADPAERFAAAGAALAELHLASPAHLQPISAPAQATAVRAAGRQIGVLRPDLASQATRFGDLAAARIQRLEPVRTVVHGDFSADQVVRGTDGRVTLIDLDSAGIGDPAIDLGCAAAALECESDVSAGHLIEAMQSGYATVQPLPSEDRLAVYTAAHLLRRAGEAFRSRDADWAQQMRRLLDRAEDELASARRGTPR